MSAREIVIAVTPDGLQSAMEELEESGSVEWADLEGNPVRLQLPLKEYAYDGKKDIVLRVKAANRAEADAKMREIMGEEESFGIQYENGVHGTAETINEMPVCFEDPDDETL